MKVKKYAEGTTVSIEKSKMDIEREVKRYGGTRFLSSWTNKDGFNSAVIMFEMPVGNQLRQVKFTIPMPTEEEIQDNLVRRKTQKQVQTLVVKEEKRRWRVIFLVLKAMLEAASSGLFTFDEIFMAHLVLSDGKTVGNRMIPDLEHILKTANMPALNPGQ